MGIHISRKPLKKRGREGRTVLDYTGLLTPPPVYDMVLLILPIFYEKISMNPKTTAKRVYICRLLQYHGFWVDEESAYNDIFIAKKKNKKFLYIPTERLGIVYSNKKFVATSVTDFIHKAENVFKGIFPPSPKQKEYLVKLCEMTGTQIDENWLYCQTSCSKAIDSLKQKKEQMRIDEYYQKQTQEIFPPQNTQRVENLTKERSHPIGKWQNLTIKYPYYGYVYVIKGIDRCKIGMSADPETRTRAIISQSGIGKDAEVEIFGPLVDCRLCEAKCHKEMEKYRVEKTEWFTDTYENCCKTVEKVIKDHSLLLTEEKKESILKEAEEFYGKKPGIKYG